MKTGLQVSCSCLLMALSGAAGCSSVSPAEEAGTSAASLVLPGVSFKTVLVPRYLSAQNDGGSSLSATAPTAQAWERFSLDDLNGGDLVSGDSVTLRSGSGFYWQALNGGGSSLNVASKNALGWETFKIVKRDGAGKISNGDVVGLQTSAGSWISAQNGGGGSVFAYGGALGSWEQLAISGLPAPSVPVPPSVVGNVSFRTSLASRYVGAQNNGGGAVVASATAVQAWETFTLEDLNGGSLDSGDSVLVRAGSGQYWQATGGGGATLSATGTGKQGYEVFKLVKKLGGGAIKTGDIVGLQTASGAWVSAEQGGGGSVFAYGGALGSWESFIIGIGAPPASDWRLVWSDEFDGATIDGSKWAFDVQPAGWVNNEKQSYTSRPENARVEGGHLVIEARRDFVNGEYSSARLKTAGKASWTYGRFEARIRAPGGLGTWPAFWMMPDDFSRGWPACGEIDVLEEVGYEPDVVHATTHSLAYNWKSPNQRTAWTTVPGVTSEYHVYAVEWFPDRIDFYADGRKYYTSPNDNTGDDAWPFNKKFYLILNLAVGGDWGGAKGVDPAIWPRQMWVDYVRVYQR